jgi:hypothetical protein
MTGLDEMAGHRAAHDAGADEGDAQFFFAHAAVHNHGLRAAPDRVGGLPL